MRGIGKHERLTAPAVAFSRSVNARNAERYLYPHRITRGEEETKTKIIMLGFAHIIAWSRGIKSIRKSEQLKTE